MLLSTSIVLCGHFCWSNNTQSMNGSSDSVNSIHDVLPFCQTEFSSFDMRVPCFLVRLSMVFQCPILAFGHMRLWTSLTWVSLGHPASKFLLRYSSSL